MSTLLSDRGLWLETNDQRAAALLRRYSRMADALR